MKAEISGFVLIIVLFMSPCVSSAQQPGLLSAAAMAAAGSNDFKPAIEELSAIIAKDENNIAALTNRANVYSKAGMPEKALADAQLALKKNKQNFNAAFIAGSSLIAMRQPAKAILYFDTVLSLKPDWLQALQFRGKLLVQTAQYDAAIADLNRVTTMEPKGAEAYLLRARAFTKKYRNEEAIRDYITVTNLAPKDSKLYELAKTEIQEPIKEYEDLKAAMNAPSRPSKDEEVIRKAVGIRKELWDALGNLSMKTLDPVMKLSLAKKEQDRAAFNEARKEILEVLQLKEKAFTKANQELKALNYTLSPESKKEIEDAHKDNLKLIRDFTDASM